MALSPMGQDFDGDTVTALQALGATAITSTGNTTTTPLGIGLQVRRSANTAIDGALWVRTSGSSPRLRQPFSASQNQGLNRDIVRFPLAAGTDVSMRVLATGANSTDVVAGMQIRLVKN